MSTAVLHPIVNRGRNAHRAEDSPARKKPRVYGSDIAYRLARRLTGVRIGHVLVHDMDKLSAVSRHSDNDDFEYCWLTADEIRAYACDPANDLDASIASQLVCGRGFCFAALDGSTLASYGWYALDGIGPEHSLGAGLSFPADSIYYYKAYTRPEYRGRGLHPATLSRAASLFAQVGISRMVTVVEYANWPSLRSHAKLGFQAVGQFAVGRWFAHCPQLDKAFGIRFGGQS